MTEGWAAIPNWLVRDEKVSAYAKLLYTVIQSHAGSSGTARLLNSTIAREANVSAKTVERYLNELVDLGVLYWVAQGEATRRTASVFHPLQEPDAKTVRARHRPAKARRTVSPTGTASETVLTQVNPQDSAPPAESVQSVSPLGTVPESASSTAPEPPSIPSERRYIPSERRREEEPSKKNPPPPSPPPPSSSSDSSSEREPAPIEFDGAWMSLVWRPRIEAMKHAAEHYPGVDLYAVTVQYIEYAMGKGWDLTSGYWLAQVKRQHDHENREQIGYDEAYDETVRRAREEAQRRWNEARGIE